VFESSRRVPTSVLVVIALIMVGLGATWWTAARPAPVAVARVPVDSARAPAGSIVVLRLDDGRVLKYESGGSVPPASWHRRCRPGLRPSYSRLRSVGQDNAAHC
jgi:hypothetical protein